MGFWLGFTCLILIIYFVSFLISKDMEKYCTCLIILVLLIIGSFRYMIGWDYNTYVTLFQTVEYDDVFVEKSFIYLSVLLRENGFTYQMMFLVYEIAILCFLCKGVSFYTKKTSLFWTLYAFFPFAYMTSLGTIRQALAGAIIFWGTQYILKNKRFKYILSVLLASLVHTSSIICLPLFLFVGKKYKYIVHILLVLVSIAMAYANIVSNIVATIFDILDLRYINYIIAGSNNVPSVGYIAFYGGMWGVIVLLNRLTEKSVIDEKIKNISLNMSTLTVVSGVLLSFSYELIRVQYFFSIFYVISICLYVNCLINWDKIMVISNLFVFLSVGYFFVYLNNLQNNPQGMAQIDSMSAGNINYEFNWKLIE